MASLSNSTLLSLEKKRARDRRAQRKFRHRKDNYISVLESHLEACNEQIEYYLARIRDLENTSIPGQTAQPLEEHPHDEGSGRSYQTDLPFVHCQPQFWHFTNLSLSWYPSNYIYNSSGDLSCQSSGLGNAETFAPSSTYQSATDNLGHSTSSISYTPSQYAIVPQWTLTPLQGLFMWDPLPMYSLFGGDLRMVKESPDFPSPLELLYGSRRNRLANFIHDNSRLWGCHDPERLAGGWLNYVLAKWIAEPSESRYKRIPEFLRPVAEQLRHPHHACIDIIVFPQLRSNLISQQHLYDLKEVLGLLSRCLKVRWPWGKNFLAPSDDAVPYMAPEFYNSFMSLSGWGLTGEFISKHPELLDKMDIESVYYQVA